jgi:glycerol-3-phosphate dehydrogenase (NAD(P)+)
VKVAVLGAGSWGTTLASSLALRCETTVWARERDVAEDISERHENPTFLSGFALPGALRASDDIERALEGAEVVVFAVPSQHFRSVAELAEPHLGRRAVLVSVTKGIEPQTCLRMTEVLQQVLATDIRQICVLAGPNLAREVMAGHPSATVLACADLDRAQQMQRLFMSDSLRVYTNPDVIGCEIGGAVKNVIAIAAGIADGLGYGWNTKAALITRGLAELARLGVALGGTPLTFLGLAGNGDLTATCSSPQSRNRGVGEELGKGRTLAEILSSMRMVAEGVGTTPGVLQLAGRRAVDMPICQEISDVLAGAVAPADVVTRLMRREAKPELHDLNA